MSLQSDYELTLDPLFRGRVLAALSKRALQVAGSGDEDEKAAAIKVLRNVNIVAEQVCPLVAAMPNVDTSASDKVIEDAVESVVRKLLS